MTLYNIAPNAAVLGDTVESSEITDATITAADIASGTITAAKLAGGFLKLVSSSTVSGGATSSISFSSLDINTDGCYVAIVQLDNAVASDELFELYVNGDTTATNYHSQRLYSAGAAAGGGNTNNAGFTYVVTGQEAVCVIFIFRDLGGYFRFYSLSSMQQGANLQTNVHSAMKSSATVTNVTSLSFNCTGGNGWGNGSNISLYKLDVT